LRRPHVECKLSIKGKSCDLAIRINGESYFVDGLHIDSLVDAHAKDGFCNFIREANVQGNIKDDRFASSLCKKKFKEEILLNYLFRFLNFLIYLAG
jgi:hypothetical protein